MKFDVKRDHFSQGLQQVLNVVGTRATMPILSNVLIEAEEDSVGLTTTNLDLGIRCRIRADVETPGAITLPVRKLATIIRELPILDVQVETSPNNQTRITSGGSRFKMMGIGRYEFPSLPTFDDEHLFHLSQSELTEMLRNVSYAQSSDETRYIMNGVYFSFNDEKLTLAATDGRRLAVMSKEMEISEENAGQLILPAKTVAEIERLLGQGDKVKVAFNDRQVAFELEVNDKDQSSGLLRGTYLVSKVVEGKYPNYRQVIPRETRHRIKVERELLLDCVRRAALVTSDRSSEVKVKVHENLLEVTGSSPEYGDSHESMAVQYSGPEVSISFNPEFLIHPLRAQSKEEIIFEFQDDLNPGVFRTTDSFLCVVMPLRLN